MIFSSFCWEPQEREQWVADKCSFNSFTNQQDSWGWFLSAVLLSKELDFSYLGWMKNIHKFYQFLQSWHQVSSQACYLTLLRWKIPTGIFIISSIVIKSWLRFTSYHLHTKLHSSVTSSKITAPPMPLWSELRKQPESEPHRYIYLTY